MNLLAATEVMLEAAEKATQFVGEFYEIEGMSGQRYRWFINNLICALDNPAYLEMGLWAGSTFCSAIHGNRVRAVGVDDWSGVAATATDERTGGRLPIGNVPAPRGKFCANFGSTMAHSPEASVTLIERPWRKLDFKEGLPHAPFDVFFYDAGHDARDQYDSLVYALPALNSQFLLIVDDWNWDQVRAGTLQAITDLKLQTRLAAEIRTAGIPDYDAAGPPTDWYNGYFFAVLEKPEETHETRDARPQQ